MKEWKEGRRLREWVSWVIVFGIIAGATLVAYFLGQWATGN